MKFRLSLRSARYALHKLLRKKTTTLDGLTLICDDSIVDRSICREIIKGIYEYAERQLARRAIRTGDKVLEVGTGVGAVSILCNKLAGQGNVTSYEANLGLETIIRRNFALNGMSPNLIMKAVTVDGQPITFYRNRNVVSSSVYDRGLEAEKVTVASDAMTTALHATSATVVVMDVEGAEISLLGETDLSSVREIIVELHPHIVGKAKIDTLLQNLETQGFTVRQSQHKTAWLSRAS